MIISSSIHVFSSLPIFADILPKKEIKNEGIWQLLRKRERYINSRINGLNKRLIKRSKMSLDSQITLLTIIYRYRK